MGMYVSGGNISIGYVLGTFKNKDDAEFFVDKLAELTNAKGVTEK